MPSKRPVPFLQVVKDAPVQARVRAEDFAQTSWQSTLFARHNPSLLIFVDFERSIEPDFLTVLAAAKPRFMIDLRLVPRFDIGRMNRKIVFSLFAQSGTQYFDVLGRLSVSDSRDARLNPYVLANYLRGMVFQSSGPVVGPIGFLVDPAHFEETYVRQLTEALSPASETGWEVLKVPYGTPQGADESRAPAPTASRNLVFISHASPEDNEFTLWLGTQLACAGYQVWSDVTRLLGGEEFWESIEEAIRLHAAKVVVVLSRIGQTKKGLLDEINCAVAVERSKSLESFVVPVRLDDLPFHDIRANLARKNVINFHANWARGLAQLMKVLERDGVPKAKINGAADTAAWCREHLRPPVQLSMTAEPIISNWLSIRNLPEHILLHAVNAPLGQIDDVARSLAFPSFRYLRLIGSFAEAVDLQPEPLADGLLNEQYRLRLEDFLAGGSREFPGPAPREAYNFVSNLIRQAWEVRARAAGLLPYETAAGQVAWFPPKGLIDSDRVIFTDAAGKRRRKNLVGWSERRKVHWHLAMELRPVLGHVRRMVARTHIVFTTDGRSLLDSKERMHAMRRRFCRSWWNDRWRDLLLAFANWLAEGRDVIELPTGATTSVTLGSSPLMMMSPVSAIEEVPEEDTSDEIADDLEVDEGEDGDDLVDDWHEEAEETVTPSSTL